MELISHFNIKKGDESMIQLEIQNASAKLMNLNNLYIVMSFGFIVSSTWMELKIVCGYRWIGFPVEIHQISL